MRLMAASLRVHGGCRGRSQGFSEELDGGREVEVQLALVAPGRQGDGLSMRWLPAGATFYLDHPRAAFTDLWQGLLVGIVFWPLAVGNAALAKVPPSVSINTSLFSPVAYLLLGSLPLLSVQSGSTAALCLGELLASSEDDGDLAAIAGLLAVLVGAMHFLMGLLDLGAAVELFSQPLLRARTGAAALIVLLGQTETLLGLSDRVQSTGTPIHRFVTACSSIREICPQTAGLSAALLAFLLICKVLGQRGAQLERGSVARNLCASSCTVLQKSANLAILVAAAVVQKYMADMGGLESLERFETPSPEYVFQRWTLQQFVDTLPTAALTAFLTLGSHLTVAEKVRRPTDSWNPRRELFALGSASLLAALVGGMPVMANLAICQALQGAAGGLATFGNILGHLVAFVSVSQLSSFDFPRCAVSVILVVEFAPLLRSLPREIWHLWQQACLTSPNSTLRMIVASDLSIYSIAFLSPLVFGIVNGSLIAVCMQVAVSLSRFAGPGYVHIGRVPGTTTYDEIGVPGSSAVHLEKIVITRPLGPRWFGNAAANTRAARRERRNLDREILVAIADWRMVSFLDETALMHYKREWSNIDVKVLVTNACATVRRQIKECGLADVLQQPEETLADLHAAVLWAQDYIKTVARMDDIDYRHCFRVHAGRTIPWRAPLGACSRLLASATTEVPGAAGFPRNGDELISQKVGCRSHFKALCVASQRSAKSNLAQSHGLLTALLERRHASCNRSAASCGSSWQSTATRCDREGWSARPTSAWQLASNAAGRGGAAWSRLPRGWQALVHEQKRRFASSSRHRDSQDVQYVYERPHVPV
ncbi:Sulfate transporter 4.1, chloroplastic [Symbiodinium microadriaticum]|uniref:Sulfate transporter 4.1, chloroplastic n=1 Tax=Symbiodinium microadriaticum TaxID=2951 RepID=A0A1Q9CZ44_SYMMI|nr:Sulfate transporter 4.1, chloroplastic [Symbiodinium microadriaticum]